jgi:type IV secretion system protein VirD4
VATPNVTKPVWAGKFALIPIVIFFGTLFFFMWYATEYVAGRLAYQSQLGEPWLEAFGWRLYKPWDVLAWNYWFHYYARDIFTRGMIVIAGGALIALVASLTYAVWIARRAKVATSQGTAEWAKEKDIAAAGLLSGSGVMLGLTQDGRYLQENSERHVLATAPTGSGKGVGQIIPTLLGSWTGSVVVHDIKGENWEVTAGYRAKFSNVLYFNPCKLESCHFNPLFEIRPGINQVKDAQNIVAMLIDPLGKKDQQFWDREATTLLVACLLHVLYCEKDKSLAGVAYFLADPDRTATETIEMMRTRVYPDRDTTRFINSSAQQAAQKYEKELSGVISTCLSVFGLYRDPLIEQLTADSDFKISDLMESKNPVSLYLVIPPSDDLRIMPLVRLMWSQIGRRLMEEHNSKTKRHKMLLMMDEFPTLGYMEIFHTGIAKIRSYGVKVFIVTQSTAQIEDVYGPNHPFTDNCDVRTFNTPNGNKTAEAISTALGAMTEVHQQKTYTGHRLSPWLGHVMVADQESARPLLTPGEVLTFGDSDTIIFVKGTKPIRAKKLRYFEDKNFTCRVMPAPTLTLQRPYPYRVKPQPNPWLSMPKITAAAAGANGAAARGANDERGLEREIGENVAVQGLPEQKQETEVEKEPTPHMPDEQFELWHEHTLNATNEARMDVAEELPQNDLVQRAEFDREQTQKRRAALEKRHRAREQERGR